MSISIPSTANDFFPTQPGSAPRILVVDDNPATLYSTSRILRSAGFVTVEAMTGNFGSQARDHIRTADDATVIAARLSPD